MEAGAWQQTAFLAALYVKLRLVDWTGLTVLVFSCLCGRVLVFFVKSCDRSSVLNDKIFDSSIKYVHFYCFAKCRVFA